VVEEELRGTSGRVLFNGCYIPAATAAITSDHDMAATMTELIVTLPAPVDPSRPPVGCAWVQAVSDSGPTRQGLPPVHFSPQPEPFWSVGCFVSSLRRIMTSRYSCPLLKPPNVSHRKCLS